MFVWEHKLLVRRRAVLALLAGARARHHKHLDRRNGSFKNNRNWADDYGNEDKKMLAVRQQITLLLDEYRWLKEISLVGPIVGDSLELALTRLDSEGNKVDLPGPTIIDLIDRHAKWEIERGNDKIAEGMYKAYSILVEPYRWLDEDEQKAYRLAETAPTKIESKGASKSHGRETISAPSRPAANVPSSNDMDDADEVEIEF